MVVVVVVVAVVALFYSGRSLAALQLKALDVGDVHNFLGLAIDRPSPMAVDNALQSLQLIGALGGEQDHPKAFKPPL